MYRKPLLVLLLALAGVSTTACSPVYVLRAGLEEVKILSRRQPIEAMIDDPATDAETRRKLQLVLQARTFAAEVLGLNAGESYTTYSWIDRDTLALVLSAARQDRFEALTWWFPIVGRVPYKGFWTLDDARSAAERLQRRGYDTYIRPTTAFSTLGWFNDPLLSTVLRYDDVSLVATVIHELTHNTIFIPGHVAFNESFASFVGDRGAAAFFCGIEGDEGERCQHATKAWADNIVFGEYLTELVDDLEAVYARTDLDRDQILAAREAVFENARSRFAQRYRSRLQTPGFANIAETPVNNAHLIAWRLYYDQLDVFEDLYQRFQGDLPAAIAAVVRSADAARSDPYAAVAAITP